MKAFARGLTKKEDADSLNSPMNNEEAEVNGKLSTERLSCFVAHLSLTSRHSKFSKSSARRQLEMKGEVLQAECKD